MVGREFKAGVGRLGFLAGALAGARPFLAPLNAVSSRVGGSSFVELHMAVKLVIKFFAGWIAREPMREPKREPKVAGEVFRIDAAADQDGISIGGWEVFGGKEPKEARWSLALLKGGAIQDDSSCRIASCHGGFDGLQRRGRMERFRGSVFHQRVHRQLLKHLRGGQVLVHKIPREFGFDGAGISDGRAECHTELELDSEGTE